MSESKSYQGRCFCGAVEITVTGAPAAMGYCHCESCRSWSASPVNAFSLWSPDAVTVTRGIERVGVYNKAELSYRKFCTTCGGHLFTEHPPWNLIDVYTATIPGLRFSPQLHVHYETTVLRMHDGLPKLQDLPPEMGGSGVILPE